jgi:hypothetical protein
LEQITNQEVASLYAQVEQMEHLHESSKDDVCVERRIKTRKASLAHLMDFQMLVRGVMEGKVLCLHADGVPTALEYIRPSINRQFCVGAVNKKKINGVWTEEANYKTTLETDGSYLVATYGPVRVFDMNPREMSAESTEYEVEGQLRHARELSDTFSIRDRPQAYNFYLRHSNPGSYVPSTISSHQLAAIVALSRSETNLWESPLGKRWLQNKSLSDMFYLQPSHRQEEEWLDSLRNCGKSSDVDHLLGRQLEWMHCLPFATPVYHGLNMTRAYVRRQCLDYCYALCVLPWRQEGFRELMAKKYYKTTERQNAKLAMPVTERETLQRKVAKHQRDAKFRRSHRTSILRGRRNGLQRTDYVRHKELQHEEKGRWEEYWKERAVQRKERRVEKAHQEECVKERAAQRKERREVRKMSAWNSM